MKDLNITKALLINYIENNIIYLDEKDLNKITKIIIKKMKNDFLENKK